MGNSTEVIGKAANAVLDVSVGKSNLKTLLAPSGFESFDTIDELFSFVFLGTTSLLPLEIKRSDFLIGAAIQLCHDYYRVHGNNISVLLKEDEKLLSALEEGMRTMVIKQLTDFGDVFRNILFK